MTKFLAVISTIIFILGLNFNKPQIAGNVAGVINITSETVLSKETALRLIKASVRVKPNSKANEAGSGIILYSGQRNKTGDLRYYTYILTCRHVVEEAATVYVEQFIYPSNQKATVIIGYTGEVIARSEINDLALIELVTANQFKETITIATDKEIESLTLYDAAYVVGCALTDQPYITNGNISNFDYEGFYQTSAPAIFGNSGGAVALASGKLLGITARVRAFRDPVKTIHPYPFASLSIPAPKITQWLIEVACGFLVVEDQGTLEDSLQLRDKIKKEAAKEALERAKLKSIKEAKDRALKEALKNLEDKKSEDKKPEDKK